MNLSINQNIDANYNLPNKFILTPEIKFLAMNDSHQRIGAGL
jgi:hypothetical protein